ncbi:MAG: 23S rRNA (uracil(1939)-C(5))-methyltransferase [Candidatus Sedimenticola endophacoides]|uniref:23S rRNA (uracil(1939)-C(5))-methyltransferase RlmD n=1 Tax=Candidatus Sedimenticola endophacoides TaxID=2548426 RepID=A0A657Q6U0_9GAMM|nr:MAG: 23S rRNA (uracil(1939)-C(5))-methyltransferase [Candidatus Sedimenticola endophacoides]OQX33643.1 MAG: 23S rRNA (uracil(1939)-C(5))-methyltransferase [Candidatus Sedimenticola endophacoides]OQX38337.1 MAG: 23S rRNA (uracil(1939)-C(5))-methyltransferase [Candidatus Sedimenticola endophacoides]OQX41967.1 MAG: 23S rRNA (uracil(1939)-C(5))-methyltransferase [Candidatus Sedimenticola endophacoides]OQX48750.1 MAG: 23S rRNA (uracil(1939)-C(5))-methyltransferase [Candidatus Sedimenticola endoph
MARSRSRRRQLPTEPVRAQIESLSHDGRGVAHIDGKAVFIQGALPGEEVEFLYSRRQRRYDEGRAQHVIQASPERVEPRCDAFGICGGCSLQHQAPDAQIQAKQQALLDAFERIGRVRPETTLPPLVSGSPWGYRRKARLGAKYVIKKEKVLVGFREKGTGLITDTTRCHVLHPKVGELIGPLAELIGGLSIRDKVPQIEVAMGDQTCVLIFRLLHPPAPRDIERLRSFGSHHGVAIYLQEGGPETVRPLEGEPVDLSYHLPEHDLEIHFLPSDFTQVNSELNRLMIDRALDLLAPAADERVLDLFCGLGNFTLPLARRAGEVIGVEGDAGLVARARDNARRNGIGNSAYFTANLYGDLEREPWLRQRFDKVLLDPPRSGALEVLEHLPPMGAERIVYVSCYPGTLARDADLLVNRHGYRLVSAGVMDMFPHTAHVESIALFEKKE